MSSRNIRGSALALLSMLSLLFSAAAMAQAVDHYEYEKDRIYPVRTGLGLTTQIELSPMRAPSMKSPRLALNSG